MEQEKQPEARPIIPLVVNTPVWDGVDSSGPPIELLPVLRSYLSRWPLMLLMMLLGGALLLAASFLIKPTFQAHALFLPPQQQHLQSELSISALLTSPGQGALYPGLLGSEAVEDDVVRALHLQDAYHAPTMEAARATLKKSTSIDSQPGGFYELAVQDPDPARAQAIVNAYLTALLHTNNRLSTEAAEQQRAIYQQELDREREGLDDAEARLATMQKNTGVVSATQQTTAGLQQIDTLRAQITALQANLAALRESETEAGPEVVRARSQLAQYQAQLTAMEGGPGGGAGSGLSAARAPQVNLEFIRATRDVEAHRAIYELVTKQFEAAQLQAQSSVPDVEVVDYPLLPTHKSFPRRKLWAAAGVGAGLFLAVVLIFVGDRIRYMRSDRQRREELDDLSSALKRPVLRF